MKVLPADDYEHQLDEVLRAFPTRPQRGEEPKLPPAPAFPEDILPPAFARYVAAAARSIGVTPEMIAIPMLVTAGAVIGNRLHIVLKKGYEQYPTLFAAVIAPPGSAKTPATLAAQWPINQIQRETVETYQRHMADYEQELDAWTTASKEQRGPKPIKPDLEHLYSSDLTLEALVSMLAKSQGVAILRDEILSWVTSLDQYRGGKGSDRQQYLSLWSGAPIKADRKNAESIYIANPVAGVYGGIQPDAASSLHNSNGQRDGWIERLLLFYPDVQPALWTDDDLDPELADPLVTTFQGLRKIGSADSSRQLSVRLSNDAKALWAEWYDDNQAATDAARGLRRGFYSKLPNQVARLALILNTLWGPDDPQRMVSKERMQDAVDLGEFFRSHLDRVLPLIGDSSRGEPTGVPRRIVGILRKESSETNNGWIRRAVLLNSLGNVSTDDLSAALTELAEQGRIERRPVPTSTKPAEEWRIKAQSPFEDSCYSKNLSYSSRPSGDSSNSSNSGNNSPEDDELIDIGIEGLEL